MYHKNHLRLFSISTIQIEYNDLHLLLFLRHFVPWTQYFFVERMNQRYLNCVTCMIWYATFTSKVEQLRLLLKLHYIHYVLFLLKRNSYTSKTCLQVSNISFNPSLDSLIQTIPCTKLVHLGASYLTCFVSTSKTNVKR